MTPLTPADCDLRGLDYMPLFGNHLFGSEFNAAATDAEWRAALTLWWAAWNQVPAGSLPNDDPALCRLADLGRDVKGWKKLRERALHGFVLCDDGRLYHEFLCKQALVAWDKRIKEREKKAKWRADQAAKKAGQTPPVPGDKTGTEAGQDGSVLADGNGRDGTGRDSTSSVPIGTGAADAPPAVDKSESQKREAWRDCGNWFVANGVAEGTAREVIGKVAKEYPTVIVEACFAAAKKGACPDPEAYFIATAKRMAGELRTVPSDAADRTAAYLAEQEAQRAASKTPEAEAARLALLEKTRQLKAVA